MDAVTVGLDIGTTSIKAVAVDATGRVLERVRLPHRVVVPAADRMEHDAARVWRAGPHRALAALGAVRPRGVAVAAFVPSLTAVDARGRPLTAGLLYGDARGRCAREPGAGAPGPAGTGAAAGSSGTGAAAGSSGAGAAPGSSGSEVAGFLRWTARAAPGAAGYWPAQAVAVRALGGAPAIDLAVAYTASPLYGPGGWDVDWCRAAGAGPGQLPAVELPGAAVGRLDGEAGGAQLAPGTVDVWCEQLVAGADQVGDVHVICGTSLIVWAVVRAVPAGRPHPGLWRVTHPDPGLQMVGGASNAGGLFLEWAGRFLRQDRPDRPAAVDPAAVPVWVPYPRGERSPYFDPDRRASLHDLDLTHGPAALQRAGWEASAFVVRHLLDLGRVDARRIVATGGGTRVAGWMQALADCTALPVHVAADPEGAARGAAFVARLAAGLEHDLRASAAWARTAEVVEPRPAWVPRAEQRYRRFRELSGTPSQAGEMS